MRINTVTVTAMAVVALGLVAVAQQKTAPKPAAAPTVITVYKTPT